MDYAISIEGGPLPGWETDTLIDGKTKVYCPIDRNENSPEKNISTDVIN